MNSETVLVDFIPIILIYFFVSDTKNTILFSSTILGKIIAVSIILFYTAINPTYGALICMIILVYYQSDFVEETLNIEHNKEADSQLAVLKDTLESEQQSRGLKWSMVTPTTTTNNRCRR